MAARRRKKKPDPVADDDRFYYDKAIADAAVDFFSRFLCLVDAEWAGKPFRLEPWQAKIIRDIFGWRRKADGLRRYRFVRIWIPRKNGKTELAAGLAHLLTIGDGEPGAQVFSHALDGAQSALCFDKASRMVSLSAELSNLYEAPTQKGLFCPALMSSFRPLSGEAYGKHGLSPHANIGDEAHAWKNGKLHTFLIQGMGARRQPIDITISTAGEIKTYGHELYEASKAIFLDPSLDPETYVAIYEASPEDDWTDPRVWAKANPNLGVSLKREFLEAECKRAMLNPRLENDFKRYHLNIWVEQATRWLPMRDWPKNTEHPEDKEYWKQLPELMRGRKAFAGIDLGSNRDLSCIVWVFPPVEPGGRYVLVPRFWMPEDNVDDRDKPQHPYRRWVNDRFDFDGEVRAAIETTPGNVTDNDFIIGATMRDASRYDVQMIGIDVLFQGMQVAVALSGQGLPVETMRQGHLTLGAPTKELERQFISGRLEHGNHPVLEWMFRNAVVVVDSNGNIKPDKKHASEKIDGVVGAVEAFGLIHKAIEASPVNAFEVMARVGDVPPIDAAPVQAEPATPESDRDILKNPFHPKFSEARERLEHQLAMADEGEY